MQYDSTGFLGIPNIVYSSIIEMTIAQGRSLRMMRKVNRNNQYVCYVAIAI